MSATDEERAEIERRHAQFDAVMAGRSPSPFDDTAPLVMRPGPGSWPTWREVPAGYYALPCCDWGIFADMVEPDGSQRPAAPLIGWQLAARRTQGRDRLTAGRLVTYPGAVEPACGWHGGTPAAHLRQEIEDSYHSADHDCLACGPAEMTRRGDLYFPEPGGCEWYYTEPRRWGFPHTPEGAQRWCSAVAVMVLADIREHPPGGRYRPLYGHQLTGRCGICGRLLTDPGSRQAGIGPECLGRLRRMSAG